MSTQSAIGTLFGLQEVADDVLANVHDTDQGIYIPIITSRNPGRGNVGHYLDRLPKDRRIVFPTVISPVLASMLERRGYHIEYEPWEEMGEDVELWVRDPVGSSQ